MTQNLEFIGVVTRYFSRIEVAVFRLDQDLYLGDWILVFGPHTNLAQQVQSMQINHRPVERASPAEEVAVKVDEPVRVGDEVFLILDSGEDQP